MEGVVEAVSGSGEGLNDFVEESGKTVGKDKGKSLANGQGVDMEG